MPNKDKKKMVWESPEIIPIKLSETKGGVNPLFSERFDAEEYPAGTPLFGS